MTDIKPYDKEVNSITNIKPTEADMKVARLFLKDGGPSSSLTANIASIVAQARREGIDAEQKRYRKILELERSTVNISVYDIREAMRRRWWLTQGRGSYEYDDDRWKDEFGEAFKDIEAALNPLIKLATDWSDCPTDRKEIQAIRQRGKDND